MRTERERGREEGRQRNGKRKLSYELHIAANRSSSCKNSFCIGGGFLPQLSSAFWRVSVAAVVRGKRTLEQDFPGLNPGSASYLLGPGASHMTSLSVLSS